MSLLLFIWWRDKNRGNKIYIKQNVYIKSHNPTSVEDLIKEINQVNGNWEKERLDMFFLEFLDDHVVNTRSEKAINL